MRFVGCLSVSDVCPHSLSCGIWNRGCDLCSNISLCNEDEESFAAFLYIIRRQHLASLHPPATSGRLGVLSDVFESENG